MHTPSGGPARWQKLGRSSLAKTRIFALDQVRFHHPVRGTEKDFVVITPPDWVNVLALTPSHELVLVRQFRFGVDDFTWEIPGGVIDAGEAAVDAGTRELREETGFAGDAAHLLGSVSPNPAIQSNRCHFVLVTDAVRTRETEWDADEEIEVQTRPVDEVLAMARRGEITHSLVLNALFLWEPWWRKLKGRGI